MKPAKFDYERAVDVADAVKLLGLLCRTGVYPAAPQPRTDAQPRGRG